MLIGLSIRLGISIHEVEEFDMPTIREYLVMLSEINKPRSSAGAIAREQSPEEIVATFEAALGRMKKE